MEQNGQLINYVAWYEVDSVISVIQKGLKSTSVTLAIHEPHLLHLNHNVGQNALFPLDFPIFPIFISFRTHFVFEANALFQDTQTRRMVS